MNLISRMSRLPALCLFWLVLMAGCSGSTGPTGSTGSISISLNPGSLSIQQGSNGQITVTVTRSGGFSGSVTLSASGTLSGVTVQSGTVGSSSTSTQLTVSATGAASTGTSTITIRATGSGVSAATASLTLTLTSASAGSFSLSLSSSSVSLAQGGNTDLQVTVARSGGFSGSVTLTASGLPSGATASFAPQVVAGTASTLTLTVAGSVGVSSYPVTIRGAGTGVQDQTFNLTLEVTAGGGGAGQIAFNQCFQGAQIDWMAFKDGNGPWTAVTPVGGVFSFELNTGRGAVAVAQAPAINSGVTIYHLTAEEMAVLAAAGCPVVNPPRTIFGSVTGMAANNLATVHIGNTFTFLTPANQNFQFGAFPPGPLNLLATLYATFPPSLDKIVIRRNLNPAHNDVLPVIDFSGVEAVAPVVNALTINNILGETTSTVVNYLMDNGPLGGLLYSEPEVSANPNRTYHGVPASHFQAGDLHRIAVQSTAADLTTTRAAVQYIGQANPVAVTLPQALGPTPVTISAVAPFVRLRLQYTPQAELDQWYTSFFTQSVGGVTRTVTQNFSAAYLNGGTIDFTFPNFSALVGWNNLWGFQQGATITGSFSALGWTGDAVLAYSVPADGGKVLTSSRVQILINP